jgi:hypothetical protein
MNHSSPQLKQKFWTKKFINHIFQKLTSVSHSCYTTWRQKSLSNYSFVGSWLKQFNCNVNCTSWHYLRPNVRDHIFNLDSKWLAAASRCTISLLSSDANHTTQFRHRSAKCCPGWHYKFMKYFRNFLLGHYLGLSRSKIVVCKHCLLYTLSHISVHLSTILSHAQKHALFLEERSIWRSVEFLIRGSKWKNEGSVAKWEAILRRN